MNPEAALRSAKPLAGPRKMYRCLTCGRWYNGPGSCRAKKCHLPVQEWIPNPRRKPSHVDIMLTDGRSRRVITQK